MDGALVRLFFSPPSLGSNQLVSSMIQPSTDAELTCQDVVNRVLAVDSAESVRQGPAATTLSADAKTARKGECDKRSREGRLRKAEGS
jgi:hypothetical protein